MTDHELSADYFNRTMLSSAGQSKGRFRLAQRYAYPGVCAAEPLPLRTRPDGGLTAVHIKKSRIVPDAALTGFADPLYG